MKRTSILPLLAGLLMAPGADAQLVTHRWSFNSAGPATNGTILADAISGAPGVIRGTGATRDGAQLTLPGSTDGNQTPAAISAYFDLPNGIISSKTHFTLETWATVKSVQTWQRMFDFGQMNTGGTGEIVGTETTAPVSTLPRDRVAFSPNRSGNLANQQLSGIVDAGNSYDAGGSLGIAPNTQYQFVVTYQAGVGVYAANGGQLKWYRNGTQGGVLELPIRLNQMEDVNNWLGRSQRSDDQNANIAYDEVRLYDHVFSQSQIAASFAAGPNKVFPAPATVGESITMHRGQKAKLNVLANDSGEMVASTLTIDQPPLFGTATVTADRQILYTQNSGAPTADSFTYRISNSTGQSATATVSINFAETLRLANPNLNLPSSPPPMAISLVDALPGLTFSTPVCMRTPPGETQRLFVCEKGGLLKVIPDVTAATPTATTFLDLPALLSSRGEAIFTGGECGLLSMAFHPNYAINRTFFVFYSVNSAGLKQRVARFTTQTGNPNAANTTSERILINQIDDADNHNGGDMHFGPDGYLYISVGDEGQANDTLNNSQTITKDLYSGILRIDVNLEGNEISGGNAGDPDDANRVPQTHGSIPLYGGLPAFEIPVDNPFVHTTRGGTWNGSFNGSTITTLSSVRDEFWAVGLRNPWRMSFDGSELWCGDVGQNVLEEVDIIQKGKNYGWAFREANINGSKSGAAPPDFDSLHHTLPVHYYDRFTTNLNGNSVTGGIVYRGSRISTLTGKYIFSDYVSGNIWSLVRNGANPPTVERIAGEGGIVGFGTDPSNQDILLADYDGNRILRLVSTTVAGTFPTTLTATGLFSDLADLSPSPGLLPYSVNLPFWSDHAEKKRWFVVPDGSSSFGWSQEAPWTLPTGTIWVKHFDMVMNRNPSPPAPLIRKRIETRVLVKNATGAYGVSYRWNSTGTEATLVEDAGENLQVNVADGGVPASQTWHIPSRAECMTCHTPQAGHALSFNTRQLNLDQSILGYQGNQLDTLRQNSFFTGTQPGSPNLLPRHLRPDETAFSTEARVRSYLAVNCSYCHKAGGTPPSAWDSRAEITLAETGLINGNANNNGGNPLNKLVVPGSTSYSIVLSRVAATNGFTRMPPIGSNLIDQANVALLTTWINGELAGRQSYAEWRLQKFGSSNSSEGDPTADPDSDGMNNQVEFLSGTLPKDGSSALRPRVDPSGSNVQLSFNLPNNRSFTVKTSTNLGQWTTWDVPGNQGLPVAGGLVEITRPRTDPTRFFRIELREN